MVDIVEPPVHNLYVSRSGMTTWLLSYTNRSYAIETHLLTSEINLGGKVVVSFISLDWLFILFFFKLLIVSTWSKKHKIFRKSSTEKMWLLVESLTSTCSEYYLAHIFLYNQDLEYSPPYLTLKRVSKSCNKEATVSRFCMPNVTKKRD